MSSLRLPVSHIPMFKALCYATAETLPGKRFKKLRGHSLFDLFSRAIGHATFNALQADSRTYGEGPFEWADFYQRLMISLHQILECPRDDCNTSLTRALSELKQSYTHIPTLNLDGSINPMISTECRYLPIHYPENQSELIHGVIPVNPKLPVDFDNINNNLRDPLEIQHWWGRPFITSTKGENNEIFWSVRCLNGGAWDRSTGLAFAIENKEEAVSKAMEALIQPIYRSEEELSEIIEERSPNGHPDSLTVDDLMAPNPFAKYYKD